MMLKQIYKWLFSKAVGALTVAGFAFSIYDYYIDKHPELTFDLASSSPVVEVRANIPRLAITYENQSLLEAKKTLWQVTIDATNTGNVTAKVQDFDSRDPLTLTFPNAEIVEARIEATSTRESLNKSS